MIPGVYSTLGVILLIASRNPLHRRSLIWFAVWSSLVRGGIMVVQAMRMPAEHGPLLGDVPALLLGAIVPAAFLPRGTAADKAALAG